MRGWILDLYPGNPEQMVVWLKRENGEPVRLVDSWSPSIYIAADDRADLGIPLNIVGEELAWTRVVQRRERVTDQGTTEVVEAKVKDAKHVQQLAGRIERLGPFGAFRIYNADVPPNQSYLYERDLFPLAYCEVEQRNGTLEWKLEDDVWAYDYRIPNLRKVKVDVEIEKRGRLARFTDPLKAVTLESDSGKVVIEGGSEAGMILDLARAVREADPDFILTTDGDTFLFPYLIKRAEASGVAGRLTLGRDGTLMALPARKGTSYFQYGRIRYKPSAMKLYGRVHIDVNTSFAFSEAGFEGLFELSRICRMPLHTSSRASIGKALSSLQFYHASRMGLLVPWKPTLAEHFKDRLELLVADRGGFIFEPKMGLHESVGELDFSSLYPSIMLRKNISAETVKCACCPDSKNRVPELDWNVCEKRVGIVPASIEIVVKKRLKYKELKKHATGADFDRYNQRQAALKWIGVTCLPRESDVFVREEGKERCVKIGELIDELVGGQTGTIECPSELFVAGIGSDLKAKYCKVGRLVKQKNTQKLLRIRMEDGREIHATPDHPFFTFHGSELVVKTASELTPGELIPVAKRIPPSVSNNESVDLIEFLEGVLNHKERLLWRVSGEPIKTHVQANVNSLLESAKQEGYTYQTVRGWARSGIIPFKFLPSLGIQPSQHKELRIGTGRREGGRVAWVPAVLKIGEMLGFFLGLYVADGSAGSNFVRIDIGLNEPDLLENTRHVISSLFGVQSRVYKERNARMYVLQVDSATLVQVLERVFGLPGSSDRGKLKVPEIVFSSGKGMAEGFIEGMIAGDGYASKARNFINIATKSNELLNQLGFLAARLGLAFRIANHRIRTFPLHTINFVGPETLDRIVSWRFLREAHREILARKVREHAPGCTHATYQRIPVEESGLFALTKETRTATEPHTWEGKVMCPVSVRKKISRIRTRRLNQQQETQLAGIEKLLESDLGFVRLLKIEELDSKPEYVYCFQLKEDEIAGFFTGEGLIFTHNCFGYLGFNNAKFGRIDAHIAVCAWDRKTLVDSARVAERRGYEVIHGIVDSLWLKREGAEEADYLELKKEIEEETGFPISFEGIYKWVVFLPSKVEPGLPVLNRYFGAYRNGDLKVRGIEARRHDTPHLFKRCQMEILGILAKADSVGEAREKIPECVDVFLKYARMIRGREAPTDEMAFATNLSKKPEEYVNRTLQASVAKQLAGEGVELHAGEGIRYVIKDYESTGSKRAVPMDFGEAREYDPKRYVRLLADACASVLKEFDGRCDSQWLMGREQYGMTL